MKSLMITKPYDCSPIDFGFIISSTSMWTSSKKRSVRRLLGSIGARLAFSTRSSLQNTVLIVSIVNVSTLLFTFWVLKKLSGVRFPRLLCQFEAILKLWKMRFPSADEWQAQQVIFLNYAPTIFFGTFLSALREYTPSSISIACTISALRRL